MTKKLKHQARETVLFGIAAEAKRLGLQIIPQEGIALVLASDQVPIK